MRYYLSKGVFLKHLENPSVYDTGRDELYELDEEAFDLLKRAASGGFEAQEDDFINYCLEEGLLSEKDACWKHPPVIQSPVPSLRYLELQITDRCNLRCRHCFVGEPAGMELSPELISKVLSEFELMQGLRLLITGGEPLLHRRFGEINAMLPSFSFRKILFTNGHLLDGKTLSALNADEIQISVDGLGEGHDRLRGRGTFKKAMDAVEAARAFGFDVSVSTMIHSGNLDDLDKMAEVFKRIGVKDWTVDVPCAAGRFASAGNDLFVAPRVGGKYLRYGFGGGMHGSAPGYACGLHLMSVSASGKAAKCSFYPPVGRVEEGLRACWQKIRPVRLEELACDCRYIEECRGGCRFRAEKATGNPLGKDLFRCSLYDIINQKGGAR